MPLQESSPGRVRWPEFSHVVFDCDSTLSTIEGIDVLAESLGFADEVASMTHAAMAGDVELNDVYAERLRLLQPSKQAISDLRTAYKRNVVADARAVVAGLNELGISVYVVSGGLADPVTDFATHLGIDPDHVKAVEARHDSLSGEWWKSDQGAVDQDYVGFEEGALTYSTGKAEIIRTLLAGTSGLSMLVGDGASDMEAGGAVDLFVGFGGVVRRPAVASEAPIYIKSASLAPVLPIAVGPGGQERLRSHDAREAFAWGVDLVAAGEVDFRDDSKRDQLLAALRVEAQHRG